jgi:hypothetical protein
MAIDNIGSRIRYQPERLYPVAPGAPGTVSFTATDANLQTFTGTSTGSVEAATIPEPATLLTIPIAVAAILLLRGS